MEIRQVRHDWRKVGPGALFVAISGAATDGALFARDAVSRGAIAVASEVARPADWPAEVGWVGVAEARKARGIGAAKFFGGRAEAGKVAGVNRTNGKNPNTSVIGSLLGAYGAKR